MPRRQHEQTRNSTLLGRRYVCILHLSGLRVLRAPKQQTACQKQAGKHSGGASTGTSSTTLQKWAGGTKGRPDYSPDNADSDREIDRIPIPTLVTG